MGETNNLFVSAIIVAAGKGSRMNMDINKQYIEVAGKPVIVRTLEIFEHCEAIDEIILVVNSTDVGYCKKNILDYYALNKVKALVSGGAERQDSVYNALCKLKEGTDIVLIHDGARPFVTQESIVASVHAAYEYGSACIAVPVKDTIKRSDCDGFIKETLERSTLWSIQTPQAFQYDTIIQAHSKAREEGYYGTDDAVLVEKLGVRTKLVMGSYDNIKITTKEDLVFAEVIQAKRSNGISQDGRSE